MAHRSRSAITRRPPPVNGCWQTHGTTDQVRRRLNELHATLDPVRLLKEIRAAQQELVAIADRPVLGDASKPGSPTLEQFLSGLRTAWKEGEVRPTSLTRPKPKRLRRRPDPFAAVTTELRGWFEAEPCIPRASYWSACRLNTPASIRRGNCGHCSIA